MGLSTRELPDPHWLLWCDSSLTGSTRIPAYEPALCGFVWFWFARVPSGPTVFPCVFVNITEPRTRQRILNSRFMCLEFLRSSSNADRLMGRSATFGPLTRLTARHQSPRLAYHGGMPDPSLLETFPNPGDAPYVIEHLHEEFTSVCPKTGHPDFGEILFRYEPADCCVELKSLKMYCQSFRQEGIYYEAVTNRLRDDMVQCMQPRWLQIVTMWKGRGGFKSTVVAEFGDVPECWKRP